MTQRFAAKNFIAGASINGTDIYILTQASSDDDRHSTHDELVIFVRSAIGDATVSISGLMSALDKVKSDAYPSPGNPNQSLQTNGAGAFVLVPITAGDMAKSVYDTNANDQVDNADQADKIKTLTGNDKVWITNGAGLQVVADISSLSVALAAAIAGTPGNSKVYGTNDSGTKGFHAFTDTTPVLLPRINVATTSVTLAPKSAIIPVDDDAVGGVVTINLPSAGISDGIIYKIIKKGSAGAVTIDAAGAETINGALTKVLAAQYNSVTIFCDGTEWFILD